MILYFFGLLCLKPTAQTAALIRMAVRHHYQLFTARILSNRFVRPFYDEMLLDVRILQAINCSATVEDANKLLLNAVLSDDNPKALSMFVSLLGQQGSIGLVHTLLNCPGADCQTEGDSFHGIVPVRLLRVMASKSEMVNVVAHCQCIDQ